MRSMLMVPIAREGQSRRFNHGSGRPHRSARPGWLFQVVARYSVPCEHGRYRGGPVRDCCR